jgi:hypothetical protein
MYMLISRPESENVVLSSILPVRKTDERGKSNRESNNGFVPMDRPDSPNWILPLKNYYKHVFQTSMFLLSLVAIVIFVN